MKRVFLFLFACAVLCDISSEEYDTSHDPYVPYKEPYSMAPTTGSVKVLWQMNEETAPTDALVYYGTDPNNLDQQVQTNAGWNVADEGYMRFRHASV